MTKHLVDMDDTLLTAAQAAAGEPTIKGTVKMALETLVAQRQHTEAELHQRWRDLGDVLVDLHDDEVMDRAWS